MRRSVLALATFAACAASSAHAEDRDFCANRPGRGTPACTLSPGDVMIETGIVSLARDADPDTVTSTLTFADTVVRVGVDDKTEVQAGLTGYARARSRDRASGEITRESGVGDAYLAVRHGLAGANGPAAIEGFVTLPTGRSPAGAGDWGAGMLLSFNHDLWHGFQLALTPELDAAVNASGSGRHLAFGGVAGVSHALGKALSASGEISAFEDQDPSGHAFDARVAGSLAWQVAERVQVDFESDLGVTHAAPRESFFLGFAVRL